MVEFLWGTGGGVHLGVTAVPLPGPEVCGFSPKSSMFDPCMQHLVRICLQQIIINSHIQTYGAAIIHTFASFVKLP